MMDTESVSIEHWVTLYDPDSWPELTLQCMHTFASIIYILQESWQLVVLLVKHPRSISHEHRPGFLETGTEGVSQPGLMLSSAQNQQLASWITNPRYVVDYII
jgi:hypothetical protein